jgi:hypothetical protein
MPPAAKTAKKKTAKKKTKRAPKRPSSPPAGAAKSSKKGKREPLSPIEEYLKRMGLPEGERKRRIARFAAAIDRIAARHHARRKQFRAGQR